MRGLPALRAAARAHATALVGELVDLAWAGTLDPLGEGTIARPW